MASERENDDEWTLSAFRPQVGVAAEDRDRFRRLLTELLFSGAAAPVLFASAAWLPDNYDLSGSDGLRVWLPLVFGALGFSCVV